MTKFQILLIICSGLTVAKGFLVNGWIEEWEYANMTDMDPESRPGFRMRVTQNGFDTAARLGLDAMMAYIDQLVIPDVQQAIGNADVSISNIRINRMARPKAQIEAVVGEGIYARIYKVNPKISADYNATIDWGFWVSEAAGVMVVRGKGLEFSVQLVVGPNEDIEGAPMKFDATCSFEGELNILFTGGLSDVLNLGSAVFGSNVMNLIADTVCDLLLTNIENNVATDLSSLPVNETADVEFDLNFGMVRFPQFTKEFVEVYSRGTVYYLEDRVEPPFQPQAMPEHTNLTDKMIYIYMSDYVLNSALYAGFLSGYMAYNVTPDVMPTEMQRVLRTTCPHSEVCLGAIFQQLDTMYPDSTAGLMVTASDAPSIYLYNGTTAQVDARGQAVFFVDDYNGRHPLLTVSFSISGQVTVGVNGSMIQFYIDYIKPQVEIIESFIGEIGDGGSEFQQVVAVGAHSFIIPQLTKLGETGFELPKTDEIEFVDPEIIPLGVNGTFVVATNFDLSLPQELLEKGLHTFRRIKGCKRNCTEEQDGVETEGATIQQVSTTPQYGIITPSRRGRAGRRHKRRNVHASP